MLDQLIFKFKQISTCSKSKSSIFKKLMMMMMSLRLNMCERLHTKYNVGKRLGVYTSKLCL